MLEMSRRGIAPHVTVTQIATYVCFFSGCQHACFYQNMVTERHSMASRLIIKASSKSDFWGNIIFMGTGRTSMARQSSHHGFTSKSSSKPFSRWPSILF